MVLEEYRKQGIAKQLTLDAIEGIRKDHSISALYVWSFSEQGDLSAEAIARAAGLPLLRRID